MIAPGQVTSGMVTKKINNKNNKNFELRPKKETANWGFNKTTFPHAAARKSIVKFSCYLWKWFYFFPHFSYLPDGLNMYGGPEMDPFFSQNLFKIYKINQ